MLQKMIVLDSNEISFCPQGKGNHHEFTPAPLKNHDEKERQGKNLSSWRVWVGELFLNFWGETWCSTFFWPKSEQKKQIWCLMLTAGNEGIIYQALGKL